MQEGIQTEVRVDNHGSIAILAGHHDENLKLIEQELGVRVVVRESGLGVTGAGNAVNQAASLLARLVAVVDRGQPLTVADVASAVSMVKAGRRAEEAEALIADAILVSDRGKYIGPRTEGQKRYVDAIRKKDLVFAIGPAGTGKTYLAMALAVAALKSRSVNRVILTRPAVEAGERLGFLPGDLQEKVDPYLRPLYDALYDMMEAEKCQQLIERRIVEVAPLAYMRGRTLNDSFIILDEAQNTTSAQMKMFLTRMGFGSKVIVTGDITQVDLPEDMVPGLVEASRILRGLPGLGFVKLTSHDVVRHRLVQQIVEAYESADQQRSRREKRATSR